MVANNHIGVSRRTRPKHPDFVAEGAAPLIEHAARRAAFPDAFQMESYLNAALLFCVGSFLDVSVYWSWWLFLFVYVAALLQAVGWAYLLAGSSESKAALALFLGSVLAGLTGFGAIVARLSVQTGVPLWSLFYLPLLTLLPFVFAPVVALHGVLFAYVACMARSNGSRSGQGFVFMGAAILEAVAVLALAAASTQPLPTFPWVALPAVGYLAVSIGLSRAKKSSSSELGSVRAS